MTPPLHTPTSAKVSSGHMAQRQEQSAQPAWVYDGAPVIAEAVVIGPYKA